MRIAPLIPFAAALLAAGPAAAQDAADRPSAMETYRQRTVVVYGNDPCPAAQSPDEIVVCARRPEEERYRLRTVEPEPGDRVVEQGGTARLLGGDDVRLAGGTGSCTTVGPGGVAGCTRGLNILGLADWLATLTE